MGSCAWPRGCSLTGTLAGPGGQHAVPWQRVGRCILGCGLAGPGEAEAEGREEAKAAVDGEPAAAQRRGGGEDASWVGSHPWRPFDREKDLNIGPKPVSKEAILKSAGTLGSRFGGTGAGGRSFL